MQYSFTLPESGNKITEIDIKRAVLRITVGLKDRFPVASGWVIVRVGNLEKSTVYTVKSGRSNTLSLGKELMQHLNLQEGNSVRFTKINSSYILEKI